MKKSLMALVIGLSCFGVYAKGVSPYLPVNSDATLDNDIETLAVIADIPKLTKPYNLAVIFQALNKIRYERPELYHRLNRQLLPYKKSISLTRAKLSLSQGGETEQILPNQNGVSSDNHYSVDFQYQLQFQDWLGLYAGADLSQQHQQWTGSTISVGSSWAQLDIGYREHWFSPFQDQSQLISNNAQTMPSVTLSNNLPIEFWGRDFNYELFLAQMDRQPVRYQSRYSERKKPFLAGFHFSFEPVDGWMLGLNRTMQFGGGERATGFKDVLKAFFDPAGLDNTGSELSADEEAGNQLASLTSKVNFNTGIPFSVSAEIAAEDTANHNNYQLGNLAYSLGVYFPLLLNDTLSFNYETTLFEDAWYAHHLYKDGYTNDGVVIGHWAMQTQRENGTALDQFSHSIQVGYRFDSRHRLNTTLRLIAPKSRAKDKYSSGWSLQAEYLFPIKQYTFSAGAYMGKTMVDDDFWQMSLSLIF